MDAVSIEWETGPGYGLSTESIRSAFAHTTMEPQTCAAYVIHGRAEIWAPTQNGEGTLRAVAHYVFQGWRDCRFMKRRFRGEGSLGIATSSTNGSAPPALLLSPPNPP